MYHVWGLHHHDGSSTYPISQFGLSIGLPYLWFSNKMHLLLFNKIHIKILGNQHRITKKKRIVISNAARMNLLFAHTAPGPGNERYVLWVYVYPWSQSADIYNRHETTMKIGKIKTTSWSLPKVSFLPFLSLHWRGKTVGLPLLADKLKSAATVAICFIVRMKSAASLTFSDFEHLYRHGTYK